MGRRPEHPWSTYDADRLIVERAMDETGDRWYSTVVLMGISPERAALLRQRVLASRRVIRCRARRGRGDE